MDGRFSFTLNNMLEMIFSRKYVPVLVASLFGSASALGSVAELSEKDYLEEFPVVYSATRLPQPLADAPASITVIDREMIERTGARSVAELMRLVPGFLVAYFDGAARPYATYHGDTDAFNRHLQVYVDGRSVYSGQLLGSATYGLLGIALDEIERIEVVRGSNSASQGANAYLGSVNITTRHTADTVGGMVSIGSGEGGIADGSARLGWGDEHASYRISLANRRDNGFRNRFDDSDRTTFNVRADLRPTLRDEVSMTAGSFGFDWGTNVGTPPQANRTERYRSHFAQARWRRDLEQGAELRAGVFADEEQYFEFFPNTPRADGRARRIGTDIQHSFSPRPNLRWVWGVEYRSEEILSNDLYAPLPDQANHLWRGFGNLEWRVNDRWLVNVGGVWERHSILADHIAPRYALNYKLTPEHTLRAAMTTAYKVPSQFELRSTWGVVPGLKMKATGGARPERIDSSEIGYLGEFQRIGLSVDVRGFVEKSRSFLKFDGAPPNIDIVNKSPFTQRGWETQIRWRFGSGTQILANHTQLNVILDPGTPAGDAKTAPRHFSSLALFQELPWDMNLSVIHSLVEAYVPTGQGSPAYHQTDLRLAKSFRMGGYRTEAAFNVLAAEGPRISFNADPRFGSVVDRRAFVTLKVEF